MTVEARAIPAVPAANSAPIVRLTRSDIAAYSVPMVACYFLLGPVLSIMPAFYAKYFGLKLTTVAAVILCTRILDTVSDTAIGYLSDRHRRAGGTRKAWVIAGGLGMSLAAWYLFAPPPKPSVLFYFAWNFTFFLAYSLMEIPHITWGGELTREYQERSTVYSFRSAAIFGGFILWAGFPILPFFRSHEFTPEVLRDIAYAGTVLMVVTITWATVRAPGGIPRIPQHRDSWRQVANSIIFNRPLLLLLAAYLFCVLGLGMWQGLIFLYLDSHMALGGKFALMQLLSNVAALAAIPAWKHLAHKYNKSTIWMISMALFIGYNCGFLMLAPGAPWWQALTLMALIHTCFSCLYMIVPSILSDVVDYGELKFHQNRGATYFALNNLLAKTGFGVGSAVALSIAGYYGVDATRTMQMTRAVWGLQLAYIIIPTALVLISCIFIWFTPINRHRHGIVCRRIESRAKRPADGTPA